MFPPDSFISNLYYQICTSPKQLRYAQQILRAQCLLFIDIYSFANSGKLKIFYQTITTTFMSSTQLANLNHFKQLEKEYPGISRNRGLLTNFCQKKLATLAELIKYNVPRAYYSQQIMRIDDLIQEIYDDSLQRGLLDQQADYDLPAEIMRKMTPISDEEEAEVILQNQNSRERPQKKFSILEIKSFLQKFNKVTDQQHVNRNIVRTVCQLSQCRKQKAFYQNYQTKEKEKNISVGQKFVNRTKENAEKKEIIIKIGDKIPIEVREMRNYVKKISQNSFAVSSQKRELQKTDIERQQTLISLSLNKVVKENLLDIFGDIQALVIGNQMMANHFVCEILNKCMNQPKMAEVYLQFVCLFTKISPKYFNWKWAHEKGQKKSKINCIHRLVVEKLQQIFNKATENSSQAKNLKHISFMIGNLIYNRKLSRKVFLKTNNIILSKILKENENSQKQSQQNYFEALISLIQSMKQTYQQNWATVKVSEILASDNFRIISKIKSRQEGATMKETLIDLAQYCNFSTSRIKCLVQNLFSRKQSLEKPENPSNQNNKQSMTISESKVKELIQEQNGFPQIFNLYSENKSSLNLLTILMALFDDKQKQVHLNTDKFNKANNISQKQFESFWQEQYINLMFGECDLPYMVESLVKIMRQYCDDYRAWIIVPEKDNEDYEDVECFMEKIAHAFMESGHN